MLDLVTAYVWGGGGCISMEITALTLAGWSQIHSRIFTFITAASASSWGSQHNQLHQKPLSVLANSYPSTYPNGLWAPCPKVCVLITSGLRDKFLHGSPKTGELTNAVWDLLEVVREQIHHMYVIGRWVVAVTVIAWTLVSTVLSALIGCLEDNTTHREQRFLSQLKTAFHPMTTFHLPQIYCSPLPLNE